MKIMKTFSGENAGTYFGALDLQEQVAKGVAALGFEKCTPIQAMALPITLKGKDVAAQAQTGTGKTATFLITIFDRLLRDASRDQARPRKRGPRALIIAPTRELAVQICDEAKALGQFTDFKVLPVFGGIDYTKQGQMLQEGTDIVVATPGRLIDYIKQKVFSPRQIEFLVIDEADRMFDMGFVRDLRFILKSLPPYNRRQSMLFSATLSYSVMELAYEHMNDPQPVFVAPTEITVKKIDQVLYHVGNDAKLTLLLGLLDKEVWNRILIFANTRMCVEMLADRLGANQYAAVGITGDVTQKKRLSIMQRFKAGETKILVATDVASRGIHVEDIDIVINYDVPQDPEDYVHRIGRTGRAGKEGRAITLACEKYIYNLESIEKLIEQRITAIHPDDDLYKEDKGRPTRTRHRASKEFGSRKPGSRSPGIGRTGSGRPASGRYSSGRPGGSAEGLAGEARAKNGNKSPQPISEQKPKKRAPRRRRKKSKPEQAET